MFLIINHTLSVLFLHPSISFAQLEYDNEDIEEDD